MKNNDTLQIIHTFRINCNDAICLSKFGYTLTLGYPKADLTYCIVDSKERKFIAEIEKTSFNQTEDDGDYEVKIYDICKYYRNLIIHNKLITFKNYIEPYMNNWFIKQCYLEHTIYDCDTSLKDFTLNPTEIQQCLKNISVFMLNYTDFMLNMLKIEKKRIDSIAFSDNFTIKHSELQGFIRNYINKSMECPQLFEIWKHLNETEK